MLICGTLKQSYWSQEFDCEFCARGAAISFPKFLTIYRIMRPNTPHLVVTPEHAICHGGHFYAMSTIRDTCFGIYHTFIGGALLTNTEYSLHAQQMLTRMLFFIRDSFVDRDEEVLDGAEGGNPAQYRSSTSSNMFKISKKCIFPIPQHFMGSWTSSLWRF